MPGRNEPCPCGSGKKYKKCCGSSTSMAAPHVADLGLAVSYFEQGNYPQAVTAAEAFLKSQPKDLMAWQILGVASYYTGQFTVAEKAFRQMLKHDPEDTDSWNNLGQMLYEQNQFDEAGKCFEQALKLEPGMPGALNNMGNVYRSTGELIKAIDAYQEAINAGMQGAEIYCNLGTVQHELGDTAAAEKSFKYALSLEPDFYASSLNLGAMYLLMGQVDDAFGYLMRAYEINPGDVTVLTNLARYWQDKYGLKQALSFYLQAKQLEPDNIELGYRLGLYYQTTGNLDKALSEFNKIIQHDQKNSRALIAIGEILYLRGSEETARKYFEKGFKYDGFKSIDVVRDYNKFLVAEQEVEKARKNWEELKHRYPGHQYVEEGMIDFYIDVSDYAAAESILQKLCNAQPENISLLYKWAEMNELRNQLSDAKELVDRVLVIDPKHRHVRLLQARLFYRDRDYNKSLDTLNALESLDNESDAEMTKMLYFEKSKVLDKIGAYDDAFELLEKALELRAKIIGERYDEKQKEKKYKDLKKVYSKKSLSALLPGPDLYETNNGINPIFIVGFPRSGTTLVEQILSSHSQVMAGGELLYMNSIKNEISSVTGSTKAYPHNLTDEKYSMSPSHLIELRERYLNQIQNNLGLNNTEILITDKLPHNAENIGLIHLLFPKSPIIYLVRHPLDACLSACMANFSYGSGHAYASSIKSAVNHYIQLSDLVDYYNSEFNLNLYTLKYEDLVSNHTQLIPKLVEFVGLDWEAGCVNFNTNKRVAKTASYAQVSEKMYTSSRYRYKNYFKLLEPYAGMLEDSMIKLNYTFEH